MAKAPSSQLVAAIARTKVQRASDSDLDKLRERVRHCRDLEMQASDYEARLDTTKKELGGILRVELPDMFEQFGVTSIGIPAEGNNPAYTAEAKPYYNAKIKEENAEEALGWLDEHGHGDLAKHVFTIELGRNSEREVDKLCRALDKLGIDYVHKRTVPWNTLTAFVKEQIEKHNATLPLDLLGATVGKVVKLKEKK